MQDFSKMRHESEPTSLPRPDSQFRDVTCFVEIYGVKASDKCGKANKRGGIHSRQEGLYMQGETSRCSDSESVQGLALNS